MNKVVQVVGYVAFILVIVPVYGQRTETHYRGTIGKKLEVYLRIERSSDSLQGAYFYLSQDATIPIAGIAREEWINLTEYGNGASKAPTGYFECRLVADSLIGVWISPDRTRQLPVRLVQNGPAIEHVNIIDSVETPEDVLRRILITATVPVIASRNAAALNAILQRDVQSYSYTGKIPHWDVEVKDSMEWYEEASYTIEYIDNAIVSISIGGSSYTGGAHPNHIMLAKTFDLATGRELTVGECFKKSSLQKLGKLTAAEVRKCMSEGLGEPYELDEYMASCVVPEARTTAFTVTPRSITFEFGGCMAHAYMACGYATIPFSSLKGFVASKGPLEKFAK